MATMYSSSNAYFQHDNVPCHKAKFISNWFHEHDKEFFSGLPESKRTHLLGVVEWEIHSMNVQLTSLQKLHDAIGCNMEQNLKGMFSMSCGIHAMKN